MREKPDGTDSPLTSLAARPLVKHARHRLVEVTRRQRDGVAVGRGDAVRHLGGGHAGQARRAQRRLRRCRAPRRRAACWMRQHVPGHQHRIGGVVTAGQADAVLVVGWVPIACSSGRSTAMVLVAGQYDAGGLGRASGQRWRVETRRSSASAGWRAGTGCSIASMIALTDSSVTGHSPVSSSLQRHRQIAAALADLLCRRSPRTPTAPSVNPNWNAEIRSNAEPCSSPPPPGSSSRQQRIAERDHRRPAGC